jgi:hypothetical protein
MAKKNDPSGNTGLTANLLPKFYQTPANKKFLQATIDQLYQPGTVKKINGYVGRENAKSANGTDLYITAADATRQNYQLEPSVTVTDDIGNITFFKDYIDYINQIGVFGGNTTNHARLNKQEFYSWDPHIDWDKFVNFQNYYWLPYGPDTIEVLGQQKEIQSTYTVTIEHEINNNQYLFTPNGFTRNPVIKLFRGQTYTFEITSEGNPFSIKTERSLGKDNRYLTDSIDNYGVEVGTITFQVPLDAPTILYYQSETDLNLGGAFQILSIKEDTYIDVEAEILGKKYYKLPNGTSLSNGMKLRFSGNVTPEIYSINEFYVEGVGVAIRLISTKDLELINSYTIEKSIPFDSDKFDSNPFSDATGFAGQHDYIVIDRASQDKNNWSRYNRWFHKDVLMASAEYNGKVASLDQVARAVRPIIEFEANLKLFNSGTVAIADIDIIDQFTLDAFSNIEGTFGYNVDGQALINGQRIIFTAEKDKLVKNKIYRVDFVDVLHVNGGAKQIHLVEVADPVINQVALIRTGLKNQGKSFWYNGTDWVEAQQKTTVNQAPLFDIVDDNGISYGDSTVYNGSTFKGTKVFSYKIGSGLSDTMLGFPLSYRNISNIGDIVFNFNIATDSFQYKQTVDIITKHTNNGYLVSQTFAGTLKYLNGWQLCTAPNTQAAIRIYKNSGKTNNFDIDIFDDINNLTDLVVKIYINGRRLDKSSWSIIDDADYKKVVLNTDISLTDVITIKAFTEQPVNATGYYEIPVNLQNNPLNNLIGDFTLGEVIDHVTSIVDNLDLFVGTFPGAGNLRDLGNVTQYGTKFVQHSGPMSLALYHITNQSNNIIRSIEQARDDYNSFKRNFIKIATSLGVDGDPVSLVDLTLQKINKDKPKTSPYYFSDMVPYGATIKTNLTVVDYRIKTYPLTSVFTLDKLSNKAVGVYLNGIQLVEGQDYTFNNQGFVVITPSVIMQNNDVITTVEYDSTDGSYVPATPTKMGMWPKYIPQLYKDTSLVTPRWMIQSHDGSQVLAYGTYDIDPAHPEYYRPDYRDDLILELEKRIFNNIKVTYNPDIFDIADIIPSYNRKTDYSLQEFNQVLAPSFYKWTSLAGRDFTKPLSYDINNTLTYNYTNSSAPDGTSVPGYWRGVYRYLLDTDRPNLAPWEMLGFSIRPSWWIRAYGPSPYTGDNLPMWQDIADGMIREPGKSPVKVPKYAKPFLMGRIPVDSDGLLKSPLVCGLAIGPTTSGIDSNFVFGDVSPVEAAWRRSSHYPFSVILSTVLLAPAKTFGILLDRSRVIRNLAGQIVYKDTGLRINPADVVLPSIYTSAVRVQTAGLINYIVDHILNFIFSNNVKSYNTYITDLKTITSQLSYRLGAFSSKEQFNLLLDSKTPMSTGSVFVPKENFNLVLNNSSPIKKITYSGVIITRLQSGYEVKGYSKTQPYFNYYNWIQSGNVINVGGISENYSVWTQGQQYTIGSVVQYGGVFYRATVTSTAGAAFDANYFIKLSTLPIIGGQSATLRKLWDRTDAISVPYGTEFSKIQDVVDFLLGYGEYLKDQGFVFDNFNNSLATVSNWETSVKEFLFWTTQNWSTGQDKWSDWRANQPVAYGTIVRYNGDYYSALYNVAPSDIFDTDSYEKLSGLSEVGASVISLSPGATALIFETPMAVVDNIGNSFYDYEIFKVDGSPISPLFLDSYREGNIVSYTPRNTDGIYGASFYLVQSEQVILLDNTTIFNDVVYNPESGYRQERIKVSGHTSVDWYGGLDVPGFIFDQANIQSWMPWQDYALGDIIGYQGYYYSATTALIGTETFNPVKWTRMTAKPTAKLIPNWTYKATQFTDFYNLDSDNFSSDQQKVAQHLIGYQKRQYLDNIIQDDVSEFKFYQGMIREKGTLNVLNKLFDVLSSENKESLTFYEEWALRVGQYGAANAFENIEFILDEGLFKTNPQGFALFNSTNTDLSGTFIIQQNTSDVYLKPLGYNSSPWPVLSNYKPFLRSAGYVNASDIFLSIGYVDEIVNYDIDNFQEGCYIWVTFDGPSWNVYRFTDTHSIIETVTYSTSTKVLTITTRDVVNFVVGSYIGLSQVPLLKGFYKITSVSLNSFTVSANITGFPSTFTQTDQLVICALVTQRTGSIDTIDAVLTSKLVPGELIWTDDNGSGKWTTWKYNPVYAISDINNSTPQDQLRFGQVIAINNQGNVAAIGSSIGEIITYDKSDSSLTWTQRQVIPAPIIASNYGDNTNTKTGTTTLGSKIVLMPTAIDTVNGTKIGSLIQGLGIPSDTLIVDVNPGVSITIGQAATSSNTNSSYTIITNPNQANQLATSILISQDGSYMVTGSPLAGYAVTNYFGVYSSSLIYGPGAIVSYNNSYYQALPVYSPDRLAANRTPSATSVYWKQLYYVPVDSYGTWDPAQIYKQNSLVIFKGKIYRSNKDIYGQVSITVTSTIAGNQLVTASTDALYPGYKIVFSGNTYGGVAAGVDYYVLNKVDATHFRITTSPIGSIPVTLTYGTGLMTGDQQAPNSPSGNSDWTIYQSTQQGPAGQGAISLYKKDSNNIFNLIDTIISPAPAVNENFGSTFAFSNDTLYVSAPGYNNNTGRVYKLKYSTTIQAQSAYNPVGSTGATLRVTSTAGVRPGMYVLGTGFTGEQTVTTVVNSTTVLLNGSPNTTPDGVIKFAVIGWGYDSTSTLTGSVAGQKFGNTITISNDKTTLAIGSWNDPTVGSSVNIYKNGVLLQTLSQSGPSLFGQSISISDTATYIAISDPIYSGFSPAITNQGRVGVYSINTSTGLYTSVGDIVNHLPEQNGLFGVGVAFMNDYKTLVVYSQYGDTTVTSTFDSKTTTFDKNTTAFTVTEFNSGRVDVFDRYSTKWVFSETLTKINPVVTAGSFVARDTYAILSLGTTNWNAVAGTTNVEYRVGMEFTATGSGSGTGTAAIVTAESLVLDGYGTGFTVGSNHILVSAPLAPDQGLRSGLVYDYGKKSNKFTWEVDHAEVDKPDVSKIRKAFLYNRVTGQLVTYLDVIDPAQGKIAGIAEEELKYKSFYDPATYTVGIDGVNIHPTSSWTTDQVGMLWWDLRTAKFLNAYEDDIIYRNTNWTTLAPGASIDVYEWISTKLKPSAWDLQADTEAGIATGISGKSLYGDSVYSIKQTYNTTTQTFSNTYYFWVKNKKFIPNVPGRHLAAQDVADLIGNPRGYGYSYLALTGSNTFSLVNVKQYLKSNDVVLSVEYWLGKKTDRNVHSQWKIVSNDPTTYIPPIIEQKWIDSLCGKDSAGRVVPDPSLAVKVRYGVENRPRQGMFINRFEALKQFVELANQVLLANQIVENDNILKLESYDPQPSAISGLYDATFDTDAELAYANIGSFASASVTPVITDGKITGITIVASGKGYVIAPFIVVNGLGIGASIRAIINAKGQITGATIISSGSGYTESTTLTIRNYSALVKSDSQANGNWGIYTYDPIQQLWNRTLTQAYDVRNFWSYTDWYKTGFSQFTAADFSVETFVELNSIAPVAGEIVKVRTANAGGWLLLEKYSNVVSVDWTQSYNVVGMQNGTIQLSSSLYQLSNTTLGFDNFIYDESGFDLVAATELRIILDTLKNNIFVNDLNGAWLDLFFATVRYVHSEQPYVDWIFKTSFIKARHNVGSLDQPVTYQPNNLSNFEDYIDEVKPYKTKIREYVSSYESLDTASLPITDFDLQPIFEKDSVTLIQAFITNGEVVAGDPAINTYPWKFWLDNAGYEIIEIKLIDGGSGYVTDPEVLIISESGTGASARAYVTNGSVNRIILLNAGSGFFAAPKITLNGGLGIDGVQATASAIIGNSVVRSNKIAIKFDRIDSKYYITQLQKVETFTGTGSRVQWPLTWAPDNRIGQSSVTINNIPALRDNYTLNIVTSTSKGFTSYSGTITFTTAPAKGSTITVTYIIDESILGFTDRIQYYYNPETGQLGKDLAQLMTGIDYGGVIINGLGFELSNGWDSLPYFSDKWDSADETFKDYIAIVNAGTNSFELPYFPTANTQLNIYKRAINTESYISDGVTKTYNYNIHDINPRVTASVILSTSGITHNFVNINLVSGIFGNILTLDSTANIVAGMQVLGTGFASGQTVASITDATTLRLSASPNSQPSGALVFSENIKGSSTVTVTSTAGIKVGDTVACTDVTAFALNTTVTSIVNSTKIKISSILYRNIPNNIYVTFTRTLVQPTDVIINSDGTIDLTNLSNTKIVSGTTISIVGELNPIRLDDPNYNISFYISRIVESLAYDIGYDTQQFQTIRLGQLLRNLVTTYNYRVSEINLSVNNIIADIAKLPAVVTALTNPTFATGYTLVTNTIQNIVSGGVVPTWLAVATTHPQDPSGGSAGWLLDDNIPFIQAELIAWITANYPSVTYDHTDFQVRIQNIIEGLTYDLFKGGNRETIYQGIDYWYYINNIVFLQPSTFWSGLFGKLNSLAQSIITNTTVARLQTPVFQYKNTAWTNGALAGTIITNNINTLLSVVTSAAAPTPTITQPTATLTASGTAILAAKAVLSPVVNPNAIVNTFLANGTTNTFTIPTPYIIVDGGLSTNIIDLTTDDGGTASTVFGSTLSDIVIEGNSATAQAFTVLTGDEFIIRETTSDGSVKPKEADYDTSLSGGDTSTLSGAYATATGIAADDIIVDGDDLISPTTSPAPEEVVPGQVVDTVAIKVFDKPTTGSGQIKIDNYTADGVNRTFKLTQTPNGPGAVVVKVGALVKTLSTTDQINDYVVDYRNNQVIFTNAPTADAVVSLFSIGFNGSNVLDIDYFVADGVTTEFVSNASWITPVSSLVYVDGVVASPGIFKTDSSYELSNAIGFRFAVPPEFGSLINFIIVNGSEQSFSITKVETVATDGSLTYTLQNTVGNLLPNESNMIVRVDQNILQAPSNTYFKITGNKLTYAIDKTKFVPYAIPATDIHVIVGDTVLTQGPDYLVDLGGIAIKINKRIQQTYLGQQLIISVITDQSYLYNPTNNQITFKTAYDNTHLVQIISSYKHDILDIERTTISVSTSATLIADTADYYYYQNMSGGLVRLDRPIINDNYVWVVKNTTLLTPSVDYKLNDDHQSITLANNLVLADKVTLITFGGNILTPGIAYMQFKDMLNRVSYKRLSANKQAILTQDLNWNDTSIVLDNATAFDEPNPARNRPGVVEIRGERIEYFAKNGNTLSKLRRGTLGTGVYTINVQGTVVQDIGTSETIPYNDTQVVKQIVSDGSLTVPLDFIPTSVNDIEVFVGGYNDGTIWEAGATYAAGIIVNIGVYTYRCLTTHVSGTTFLDVVNTVTVNADGTNTVIATGIASSKVWKFFIGNIRLKKGPYTAFNINQAPYSPEGDIGFTADFTVDGVTAAITLTNAISFGTQVTVIKTTGTTWDQNTNILYDDGKISEFLRATPGIWYSEYKTISTIATGQFDSAGNTLDDTNLTFDQGT